MNIEDSEEYRDLQYDLNKLFDFMDYLSLIQRLPGSCGCLTPVWARAPRLHDGLASASL